MNFIWPDDVVSYFKGENSECFMYVLQCKIGGVIYQLIDEQGVENSFLKIGGNFITLVGIYPEETFYLFIDKEDIRVSNFTLVNYSPGYYTNEGIIKAGYCVDSICSDVNVRQILHI